MERFSELLRREQREWARIHLQDGIPQMYSTLWHKPISRRLMQAVGMETPQLYAHGVSLEEALGAVLERQRGFVKPETGGGGKSTLGLVKSGELFLNTLSGEKASLGVWKDHLENERKLYRGIGHRERWVVEELMHQPGTEASPPHEYKFYSFAGHILLICVRRAVWMHGRANAVFRWFDSDWNPVSTGAYTDRNDNSLLPADLAKRERLRNAAQHVSHCMAVPFMRIDLFDAQYGIVGGELTEIPGASNKFSARWDATLRQAWHETAGRMPEEIRTGRLTEVLEMNRHVAEETRPLWRALLLRGRIQRVRKHPVYTLSRFFRRPFHKPRTI